MDSKDTKKGTKTHFDEDGTEVDSDGIPVVDVFDDDTPHLDRRLIAMDRMIPEKGFRLVGMDPMEEAGYELYRISDHKTRKEAEAALKSRKAKSPGEELYVYGPSMRR